MQIKLTTNYKKSNPEALKVYIYDSLKHLWMRCIGSFIDSTLDEMSIDTGMSVASLMPLAIEVGFKQYIASRITGGPAKPGHKNLYGEWASNNDLPKSVASGEFLGRKPAYDVSFGTKTHPKLKFLFHIVVFQHYLHEDGIIPNSGNWMSLEAGKRAFLETWDKDFSYYISPGKIKSLLLGGVS